MKIKNLPNYIFFIVAVIAILVLILLNTDYIKIQLLQIMIFLRGVLSPNCNWYKVSDILLNGNENGIMTYKKFKEENGDFSKIEMFGETIYVVTNLDFIKTMLDNSPDLFTVGNIKYKFFKTFMEYNVGVSTGCPWKSRRILNEKVLDIDRLHKHSEEYNSFIEKLLKKKYREQVNTYNYDIFSSIGRKIANRIIFNADDIPDSFYNIFSEPNNLQLFYDNHFTIDKNVKREYLDLLSYYIDNPVQGSLIYDLVKISDSKKDILHQIPHFIFPIAGMFITVVPRALLLLCNNPNVMDKVIIEVNSIVNTKIQITSDDIYNLKYLRKCIMETLRLNNLVMTTFRTLSRDYKFNDKYQFKKGDQFLLLNNPILRDIDYFYKSDNFIPERWNNQLEQEYYSLSFSQGPQRCPGKELAIFLAQSFVFNFITTYRLNNVNKMKCSKINMDMIPQVINPCTIEIKIY